MRSQLFRFFLVLTVCIAVVGCGRGKPKVQSHTVNGSVTVDGQPATDATVSFKLTLGQPITIQTDESGSYSLGISQSLSSCLPGQAVVSIVSTSRTLPRRYNSDAHNNPEMCVELKPGQNTMNFDLLSK